MADDLCDIQIMEQRNSLETNNSSSYKMEDPPGGFLMWLVVLMEIFVFGVLIFIVARYRSLNLPTFQLESGHLQLRDGIVFTLSLLVSGFLAAEGVRYFFLDQRRKSLIYFILSTLFGFGFLVLKITDFMSKSSQGFGIEKNDFWLYYWLIMSFHFFHVLVGVFILLAITIGVYRNKFVDSDFAVRGGVLFWHMCDVVWLILFPLFYLGAQSL